MFHKKFGLFWAFSFAFILVSATGFSSRERSDEGSFDAENSSSQTKRAKIDDIEVIYEDPEFLAAFDQIMMDLNPAPLAMAVQAPHQPMDIEHYNQLAPQYLAKVTDMGMRIKLLANVYSGKLDEKANIFVPQYVLTRTQADGTEKTMTCFFKTNKDKICVFASGGTQNHWEKSVGKVYEIFFNQKIKIIRANWINKRFRENGGISPLDAYVGRETELHSELYFTLFFRNFFLPVATEQFGDSMKSIAIRAFSWWQVCDSCENLFANQKALCGNSNLTDYTCEVAAFREYNHNQDMTTVHGYQVEDSKEASVWNEIWGKVTGIVNMRHRNEDDKEHYWTKTVEGLELCKWLGQAFRENLYTLNADTAKPGAEGDILAFYNDISEDNKGPLIELLDYLREVNWELSCWYLPPYYEAIQSKWKAHAHQVVRPHFGWQLISEFPGESKHNECQMCGQQNLINICWAYHPKYKVTKKFLDLPEDQQQATERSMGFDDETTLDQLPDFLKFKRQQSLIVGSECLKTLQLVKGEVDILRGIKPDEERAVKFQNLNEKLNRNDELNRAEADRLLIWMTKESDKTGKPLTVRNISKNSDFGIAPDIHPLLKILIDKGQIEKKEKNQYVVRK